MTPGVELALRTRREQGLPDQVEDPGLIARVAAAVRVVSGAPTPRHRKAAA